MARKERLALRQPSDGRRMRAAIDWCEKSRLPVERCTLHQLRVGPWNYWPEAGSISHDGQPALPAKGLDAFRSIIERWLQHEAAEYGERWRSDASPACGAGAQGAIYIKLLP